MNMPMRPPKPQPRALTTQEQRNKIIGMVRSGQATIEEDGSESNQLVIYTGLFRWTSDNSVREEQEPAELARKEDDRVL